jgi:5S rRNA maturation endonuclease (ribonuclease M5)
MRAQNSAEFCHPHFMNKMSKPSEDKSAIEEILALIEKEKGSLVIVEGKKDKAALEELGFSNIIILNKPLYEIVEKINAKRVLVLTDLDKEGKQIYAKLKKDLNKLGVVVDDRLRNLLFKTELRQIEGLTSYLKKFEFN